jgi:ADP-ribosylglycohydrolase
MNMLQARAIGALAGAAVGDALGGATEGYSVEQIRERHGGPVTGIVGPWLADWKTARPMSPYHKGDGHVTDDTLMSNLMVRVYEEKRDHLDAYDIESRLVPRLMTERVWIPELERDEVPVIRLFLAEKWLVTRLAVGHVDPREAGVGNIVNCGAAMYSAPTGVANAGNPAGAYAEATDWAGAHQSSYGREAAGVFAAAVAAALRPEATVTGIVDTALGLAQDGTREAIEAVSETASGLAGKDTIEAAGALRTAVAPFDTVGPEYRKPARDARRPSRTHAIEELPIALGMLVVGQGEFEPAVLGAVNYGRDADSIATMAGALAGALGGLGSIPAGWREGVATGSRLDLEWAGRTMAGVAADIRRLDQQREAEVSAAFAALTAES